MAFDAHHRASAFLQQLRVIEAFMSLIERL